MDNEDEMWDEEDGSGLEDSYDDVGEDFFEGTSEGYVEAEKCRVLTLESLSEERQKLLDEVAPILGLTPGACHTLLALFKWNKEQLLERYLEAPPAPSTGKKKTTGKQQKKPVVSDSKLQVNKIQELMARMGEMESGTSGGKQECLICFESSSNIRALEGCEHWFCTECWKSYLKERICGNAPSPLVLCPGTKCPLIVGESDVLHLLNRDFELEDKYAKLLLRDFVMTAPWLRECPGADCEMVAMAPTRSSDAAVMMARVDCTECKLEWCMGCAEKWHEPADCATLKAWLDRCTNDSETFHWISAYTKDCPKCKMPIEKNGGCNYMQCSKCRHTFCWLCLADWSTHNDHFSCNRYKKGEKPTEDDKVKQTRESLRRYLHYFDRYKNHLHSQQLEARLRQSVARKVTSMQENHRYSFVETDFLNQAVTTLNECRRTLAFTYTFAFYLSQDSNETVIFEKNQEDLESATEKLSFYLETDLVDMGTADCKRLEELRQKVLDQAKYVSKRRHILLEHCVEGRAKNRWVYTEGVKVDK